MKRVAGLVLSGVLGAVGAGCATTDANWQERYLETEQERAAAIEELSAERVARTAATAEAEAARMAALQSGRAEGPVMSSPRSDGAVREAITQLNSNGLVASETADGNIAITLQSDINFGAGSKELTPSGKKTLEQVAKELDARFGGYSVRIEGHTDSDPIKKSAFKDNWELGSERALAVLRHLTTLGVSSERLTSSSRGDTMPVADNKSDKGKAKNRRVEVIVLVPRDVAMGQ